jgi:hypothetical protein
MTIYRCHAGNVLCVVKVERHRPPSGCLYPNRKQGADIPLWMHVPHLTQGRRGAA